MMVESSEVVIATKDWVTALGMISKKAQEYDFLEIQFLDAYAPTVEYLVRVLRKAFGWMEVERGVKSVQNNRCKFEESKCTHPKLEGVACNSAVKADCEHFKIKNKMTFKANFVVIEKAGGIRGM